MLKAIANELSHTSGLYLAYNKSIAVEASKQFPITTACSTIHSLAYRAVVKQFNLTVGDFSVRNISENLSFDIKLLIVNYIKEFCLSSYVDFDTFAKVNDIGTELTDICNIYLTKMENGSISCSHDFYLKVFHLALINKLVTYDKPFDFVMIDEAGDINEVTLEIFQLLPAKLKIATGDKHQNIYGFNHTINTFELLKDKAKFFNMTKSFRVSNSIAKHIESFVHKYIDKSMVFEGIELKDNTIHTRALIARTNAALVSEMIKLQKSRTPYKLVRKASEIFKQVLMVISFKYQGFITDPQYKHLQNDIDTFYEDIKSNDPKAKLLPYLLELYPNDFNLGQAIKTVLRLGYKDILDAYEYAKSIENKKFTGLVLATSHSVKGLEFDEVSIANDFNEILTNVIYEVKIMQENELEISDYHRLELNLAYVACSRAKKQLNNALFLNI